MAIEKYMNRACRLRMHTIILFFPMLAGCNNSNNTVIIEKHNNANNAIAANKEIVAKQDIDPCKNVNIADLTKQSDNPVKGKTFSFTAIAESNKELGYRAPTIRVSFSILDDKVPAKKYRIDVDERFGKYPLKYTKEEHSILLNAIVGHKYKLTVDANSVVDNILYGNMKSIAEIKNEETRP